MGCCSAAEGHSIILSSQPATSSTFVLENQRLVEADWMNRSGRLPAHIPSKRCSPIIHCRNLTVVTIARA